MGYRHHFAKIQRSVVDEIRDMTLPQLGEWVRERNPDMVDSDGYIDMAAFVPKNCFHFGKLYGCDTAERIYRRGKPLFTDPRVSDYFSDFVFQDVGREGVREAIEAYRRKILAYYEGIRGGDQIQKRSQTQQFNELIEDRIRSFDSYLDLSEDPERLTTSWMYEDSIYNLIALFKHVDWGTETILFYGS